MGRKQRGLEEGGGGGGGGEEVGYVAVTICVGVLLVVPQYHNSQAPKPISPLPPPPPCPSGHSVAAGLLTQSEGD